MSMPSGGGGSGGAQRKSAGGSRPITVHELQRGGSRPSSVASWVSGPKRGAQSRPGTMHTAERHGEPSPSSRPGTVQSIRSIGYTAHGNLWHTERAFNQHAFGKRPCIHGILRRRRTPQVILTPFKRHLTLF